MIAYLDTNVFDHLYKKIGCTSCGYRRICASRSTAASSRSRSSIHVLEEILLEPARVAPELVARVKLTLSLANFRRMVKPCDQLITDDIRSYAASRRGGPAVG